MNTITNFLWDLVFPFGNFLETVDNRPKPIALLDLVLHILPLTFFVYWIFSFIPYGALAYMIVFTFIAALKHIKSKSITNKSEKINIILWYYVVLICGFGTLRNFIGHFFLSDSVAQSIGWATGSQFQIELAFYHLGVSLAALTSIWLRKNLIVGLAIIEIVFGFGAAYVHIKDIILSNNFAPANTGSVLLGDILIPLIFIFLLVLTKREFSNKKNKLII